MKKTIHNIFSLRCLMIAVLVATCSTCWATTYTPGEDGDPLKAWYYSDNKYVLRTLSADKTVIDAMKALQTINAAGAWSDYSSCTFYLAEDVDFIKYTDNDGKWVPLGDATHPFSSDFYAYHPTYQAFYGGSAVTDENSSNVYPYYSSSLGEHTYKQSTDLTAYKLTKAQMIKVLTRYYNWYDEDNNTYEDCIIIGVDGSLTITETENTKYDDLCGYFFYENETDGYTTLPSSEELVTEGDDANCSKEETSEGSGLYKYTFFYDQWSIDGTLSLLTIPEVSESDGYTYSTPADNKTNYYIYKQIASDAEDLSVVFDNAGYELEDDDYTSESVEYDLVPVDLGQLGYYTDENGKNYYVSSDSHIGTCTISNLKVEGAYTDAGFFGVVTGGKNLGGFTFDPTCSVKSTGDNNHTGMLFGSSSNSSAVKVQDIFIGDAYGNATIEGYYAGGVCGQDGSLTSSFLDNSNYYNYDAPEYVAMDNESNYSVRNILYVSVTGGNYAGGVYACGSGSITTSCVDVHANVLGDNSAGGIAGNNSGFHMQYCNVTGTIGATGASYGWAGGLVGYVDNTNSAGSFNNCTVDAEIGSKATGGYAGGVFGYVKGFTSSGYTVMNESTNNIVTASGADPDKSISDTPINVSVSLIDGSNSITAVNWSYYFCCDIKEHIEALDDGYETLLTSLDIHEDGSAWTSGDKQVYYAFGKNASGKYGTGTEADPYIISNLTQLTTMMLLVNGMANFATYSDLDGETSLDGKYFKQTASIAFGNGASSVGTAIGYSAEHPFKSIYDGGGHTISNAYLSSKIAAPLQYAEGAVIKNLNVTGKCIAINDGNNEDIAGGLVGIDLGGSTIENCWLSVQTSGTTKGAIVGNCQGGDSNPTKIHDCFNNFGNSSNVSTSLANGSYVGGGENGAFYSFTDCAGEGLSGKPFTPTTLAQLEEKDMPAIMTNPFYQLNTDLFDIDRQLVGDDCYPVLDGKGNLLASNYTNTDNAYVQEFRGTINGKGHLIAGLVDKYLFGKLTGETTINNVGFVNCLLNTSSKTDQVCIYSDTYDNRKTSIVQMVNNTNSQILNINYCYSDGNFYIPYDITSKSPIIRTTYSYVYTANSDKTAAECKYFFNNGKYVFYNFADIKKYCSGYLNKFKELLTQDTYNDRKGTGHYMYKGDNVITITEGEGSNTYYTDAIRLPFLPVTQEDNTIKLTADKTAARYYTNMIIDNTIYNLNLIDVTDFYIDAANNNSKTDDLIKSTDFNTTTTKVNYTHYKRKAHNDWESVCLPFNYKLSDVEGYGTKFTAYDYSEYTTGGTTTAYFTAKADDATIGAGQPVLFHNADKTSNDFVVRVSTPQDLVTEGKTTDAFKGVLQSTGKDATKDTSVDGKYKIDGTATDDGGGTLLLCNNYSWIYPFRAYLDFGTSGGAKTIRFFVNNGDDSDPTQIDIVNGELVEHPTGAVYSLDGRKVSDNGLQGLKTGIYISGGKKYVVK